jgi:hypothetical protein
MRAVLAVIAGLVAWAVVATLLNFLLRGGLEGYVDAEHTMHFTLPMMVGRLGEGAFASIGAGVACALVAGAAATTRRRKTLAAITGAIIVLVFLPEHIAIWPMFPIWYHVFFLATLVPFVMVGERLARGTPGAAIAT